MKRLVCKLLLVVYLIPSIAFAQTNPDGRIKKVEAGLLPAVLIKGDPSWSIGTHEVLQSAGAERGCNQRL